LEWLTRPIPRSLWPEKEYPHYECFTPIYDQAGLSSCVVATSSKRIVVGPAFTFVGHWYAVGGPFVLAVAGFLTGAFFRVLRAMYESFPRSQGNMLLYSLLLPIGFVEAGSTPLSWIYSFVWEMAGLFVIFLTCGRPVYQNLSRRGYCGAR
jgi:hypothetical protein